MLFKMRWRALAIVAVSFAAIAAGTAVAASNVRSGARYAGTGGDYLNNAPQWTREGSSQHASLRTSSNGREVLTFVGTYFYYCGAGTNTVDFSKVKISPSGTFSSRFRQVNHGPNGQSLGHVYGALKGHFLPGGRVSVSYLIDYDLGHTQAEPYSMTNPRADGCGSLVRATLSAR